MKKIDLVWKSIGSLDSLLSIPNPDEYHRPGLYIWIEDVPGYGKCINYVGKHEKSVYKRLTEHFKSIVSGHYSVPAEYMEDNKYHRVHALDFSTPHHLASVIPGGFKYRKSIVDVLVCFPDKSIIRELEDNLIYELFPLENDRNNKDGNITLDMGHNVDLKKYVQNCLNYKGDRFLTRKRIKRAAA